MKASLLLILVASVAVAQNDSTGIQIPSTLTTGAAINNTAITIANQIAGGHHSVADTTERNNIYSTRRRLGMLCFTTSDSTWWQLRGGTANANWRKVLIPVSALGPLSFNAATGVMSADTGVIATKANVNAKANTSTTITVAATAPLSSSAGAQDLSTNRTWTITADTNKLATKADVNKANAVSIGGKPVSLIPPTDGQILKYRSGLDSLRWVADSTGGGSVQDTGSFMVTFYTSTDEQGRNPDTRPGEFLSGNPTHRQYIDFRKAVQIRVGGSAADGDATLLLEISVDNGSTWSQDWDAGPPTVQIFAGSHAIGGWVSIKNDYKTTLLIRVYFASEDPANITNVYAQVRYLIGN